MADLADIRAAVAAAIKAAVPDCQVTGYVLNAPMAPFFDVELSQEGVEYDQAMSRGFDKWTLTVRGCVQLGTDLSSQKNLDAWCASSGPSSIKAALEADLTLGGVAETLHVTKLAGYHLMGARSQPNTSYLGAEWTVEIYATG